MHDPGKIVLDLARAFAPGGTLRLTSRCCGPSRECSGGGLGPDGVPVDRTVSHRCRCCAGHARWRPGRCAGSSMGLGRGTGAGRAAGSRSGTRPCLPRTRRNKTRRGSGGPSGATRCSGIVNHGTGGRGGRWPSCCARATPDRTPPPTTLPRTTRHSGRSRSGCGPPRAGKVAVLVRTDAAGGHHASAAHLPERPPPARTTQSPEPPGRHGRAGTARPTRPPERKCRAAQSDAALARPPCPTPQHWHSGRLSPPSSTIALPTIPAPPRSNRRSRHSLRCASRMVDRHSLPEPSRAHLRDCGGPTGRGRPARHAAGR